MKMTLMAAAAFIAVPAFAQTTMPTTPETGATAGQTTTDQTMPADQSQTMPAPGTTGDTMQNGASGSMTTQDATNSTMTTGGQSDPSMANGAMNNGSMNNGAMAPAGADPVGGYAPQNNTSGTMTPGQAFPAPAAKTSYPVCKPGQYDDCMQASDARGSKRTSRSRARRR